MQREKRNYCIVLLHGLEEGEWLCSYATASQLSIRSSVHHVSNEKAPFQLLNLNAPLNMTAIAVITVVMVGVITTSSISQQQSACYVLGLLLNSTVLSYWILQKPSATGIITRCTFQMRTLMLREGGNLAERSQSDKVPSRGLPPRCLFHQAGPGCFWEKPLTRDSAAGLGGELLLLRGLPPAWASVSHFSAYYLA